MKIKQKKLAELCNLGDEIVAQLRFVGIETTAKLIEVGVVEAYCRLKVNYPDSVTANDIVVLQGALMDVPWRDVPSVLSDDLKREAWEILRAQ